MKIIKTFLFLILAVNLLTACSKDKDSVSTPPSHVAGIYIGKYGTGNNTPSSFFSFNIKADGTLQELNIAGESIGTGTWTLNGSTFRSSYKWFFPANSFFAVTANYSSSSSVLTGTWGYGSSDKDGGKFYMNKK